MELARLLAAMASADRRAFERFYTQTSARCYGLIRRIIPEAKPAQEVLEATYLTIWCQAPTYSPAEGTPLAWALSLAYGQAIQARSQYLPAPASA
ncbi:sigma factor [Pseudarthrobacter sp. 1C304]|uniref:sigma factor n=1 Tax=Pseudarthrobacter sp. 1C304 TaxID=3457438 RepID=UPI003FD3BF74